MLLLLLRLEAQAQPDSNSSTIHLTIDNDSFLFSQTDWYYTSGIYASYRKIVDQEKALVNLFPKQQNKVIRRLGFSHQVYTPRFFNSPLISLYDRPHAALLQLDYGLSWASQERVLAVQGSLGWMGSALGTGLMLVWFHDKLGYRTPRGWDYEIANSPVVQLKANWYRSIISDKWVDLTLTSQAQLGTVYINSSVGSEIRAGRLLALDNSLLFDQFTTAQDKKGLLELFLVIGGNIEYNFFNATIEGNVIGGDSPHLEEPNDWVRNGHFGIGVGGNRMDGMLLLNYRTPTTKDASRHKFVTIKLNYRL